MNSNKLPPQLVLRIDEGNKVPQPALTVEEARQQMHLHNSKPGDKNYLLSTGEKYAVCYNRVSTQEQVDSGHSLETQKQNCIDYCKNEKLNILKFYVDEGISGATLARPQLMLMLKELQHGVTVVVPSLSRLSRNIKQLAEIHEAIKNNKCFLVLLDLKIDTSSVAGDGIMKLLGVVSEIEKNQISERITTVMTNQSRNGDLRTKPRYGWKIENEKVVVNEEEQEVITHIKQLITENPNISTAEIVRILEQDNVQIRKCKSIHQGTVETIIQSIFDEPNNTLTVKNVKSRTKPKFGWKVENGELVKDIAEQAIITYIKTLIDNDPKITTSQIVKILRKDSVKIRKCQNVYHGTVENIIQSNNLRK